MVRRHVRAHAGERAGARVEPSAADRRPCAGRACPWLTRRARDAERVVAPQPEHALRAEHIDEVGARSSTPRRCLCARLEHEADAASGAVAAFAAALESAPIPNAEAYDGAAPDEERMSEAICASLTGLARAIVASTLCTKAALPLGILLTQPPRRPLPLPRTTAQPLRPQHQARHRRSSGRGRGCGDPAIGLDPRGARICSLTAGFRRRTAVLICDQAFFRRRADGGRQGQARARRVHPRVPADQRRDAVRFAEV